MKTDNPIKNDSITIKIHRNILKKFDEFLASKQKEGRIIYRNQAISIALLDFMEKYSKEDIRI